MSEPVDLDAAERNVMSARKVLSACLLSGLFYPQSGAAVAATYAAMAVVPGQGRDFHGYSTGSSAQRAQRGALARCANKRCIIVRTYGPGQCAHVVLGTRQVFWNERLFSAREREFTLQEVHETGLWMPSHLVDMPARVGPFRSPAS